VEVDATVKVPKYWRGGVIIEAEVPEASARYVPGRSPSSFTFANGSPLKSAEYEKSMRIVMSVIE